MRNAIERVAIGTQRMVRQRCHSRQAAAQCDLSSESTGRHPPRSGRATWTHARVGEPGLNNSEIGASFTDLGRTGERTRARNAPLRHTVLDGLHSGQQRCVPTTLVRLDHHIVARLELDSEHTSGRGQIEQAARWTGATLTDAKQMKVSAISRGSSAPSTSFSLAPAPFPAQREK